MKTDKISQFIGSKFIFAFLFIVVIITLITACSDQAAGQNADFGQEIVLTPGEKVSLNNNELDIRFVEVVNDSRCPTGVQCIWAGEVSVKVEIKYQEQTKSMVLTQSGSSESDTQLLDFKINLDVQPYPEAEKQINDSDYRLHLTVTRG